MLKYYLDKLKTSILLHSYNLGLEQHLLGDDKGRCTPNSRAFLKGTVHVWKRKRI